MIEINEVHTIETTIVSEMLGWAHHESTFEQYEPSYYTLNGRTVFGPHFHPMSDIKAAWCVVEALQSRGYDVEIRSCENKKYFSWGVYLIKNNYLIDTREDSVCKAICAAALIVLKNKKSDV